MNDTVVIDDRGKYTVLASDITEALVELEIVTDICDDEVEFIGLTPGPRGQYFFTFRDLGQMIAEPITNYCI